MSRFNRTSPTSAERGRWMVYCNNLAFHRVSRLYVSSSNTWIVYTTDGEAMDMEKARDYFDAEFLPFRKSWEPRPRKVQRPTNH
ncbi:hypothetical protein vBSlqSZDD2_50 [Serratia phage vB_SlqS_ZDD2]|nr:hypothetical protein vBSlqSZDD2_50 [Serratia phage vB_SlqS_ZDD2]